MRKIIFLFLFIFNLKAIDFVLIDSFNDAANSPYSPVKAGDVDQDGLAEIIFLSTVQYYKIAIYERNPGGGFSLQHILPLYPTNDYTFVDFAIGDFEEDGKIDMFASHSNTPTFYEYFEVIESKFPNSYPDTIVWIDSVYIEGNDQMLYVWAGDFDNDERTDIIVYKGGDDENELLWYENQGDNSYSLVLDWDSDSGIPYGGSSIGDLDLDGLPEIVITTAADAHILPIKVYESIGNDLLANTAEIYLPFSSTGSYDVVFCQDVNNNGKPEFMIHGHTPSGGGWRDDIWLIEATGDNQYEIVWYDTIPNNPAYPDYGARSSAGDLTGDGIPEIIISMTTRVYVLSYIPGQGYIYIWQKYFPSNTANLPTTVYDTDGDSLNEMILSVQYNLQNPWTYIYEKSPSVSEKYLKITPYFYVIPKITSDSVRVFYSLKTSKSADFYVYNTIGEKIYSKKIGKNGEFYLNLKKLKFKPGVYFLRILSPEIKKTEKIIYWRR